MKGKNLIIFWVGVAGGFIGGSVFVVNKMLSSERMRKAFVGIVADATEKTLFGEGYTRPRQRSSVSYNYDPRRKNSNHQHCFEDIVFDTRGDAEAVLEAMNDIINKYGIVSISDYCDLCSCLSDDYNTTKYGWSNVNTAMVVRCREGYKHKLPRLIPIK